MVKISDEVMQYIVNLVRATRETEGILNGASPRASLALAKTAQALAIFDGLDFVTPDHIQELAVPVIAHRLIMDSAARFSGNTSEQMVESIMNAIPVPV